MYYILSVHHYPWVKFEIYEKNNQISWKVKLITL